MLNGAQPTHTRASDAGGLHLSITKGVWAPVSTPSHLLLTLGSPLLPPSRPGSPLQPLSCDWRRGESRYLVPGRRRAKGESLECHKSEQRSHLSQLCETQSKQRIKGEDEERERLTLQWWIQQRNDTFFFYPLNTVEGRATRWRPWAEEAFELSTRAIRRVPVWAVCSIAGASSLWFLPYNQCAACKQTVQGLNFWSDRAAAEKVQACSDHTPSSGSGEGCWPRK